MKIKLGIDIGGSTTKIVGLSGKKLVGTKQVRATDQLTALFGAIGNFLHEFGYGLNEVSDMVLTGVGASYISEEKIFGINVHKVNEFQAIGQGAQYLSGIEDILAVSMGTGTAFVKATSSDIRRIGGSGVGGGTVLGLSGLMLGKSDIDAVLKLAQDGDLNKIDLMVSDIIGEEIPSLPSDLTAANFGNVKSTASDSDIALGIINMVFEVVGVLAVFALKKTQVQDVVLTGTLATFPQADKIFARFKEMTGVNFVIPKNAVFATAIGSAMNSEFGIWNSELS